MAEVTPTPAPQDAATQTSNQSAPVQTAAPTQANPVQNISDAQALESAATPTSAVAQPAATAPTAQAAPKVLPKRGLMSSVLMGALKGADAAMKATGKAVVAATEATNTGQNIRNQRLLRQQKQQEMQQAAQKAKEESVAALDKHTQDLLTIQKTNMDNIFQAHQNAQIESQWPVLNEDARLTLQKNERAEMDAEIDFAAQMKLAGIHADTSHHQPGGPYELLTPNHADRIGPQGKEVAVANGKEGPDSDLTFYSIPELQNTVLDADTKVVVDWNLDPKTKELTPVYQTLKAGENTWWDALVARQAGMMAHDRYQTMLDQQFKSMGALSQAQMQKAEADEHESAAKLNDAYVKQMGGGGNNPPLPALQDAISKLPAQVQQGLQQWSPQIQGLLIRGAYGFVDPATFPQRLTKGGIGITRADATAMMLEINPNYSDNLYNNVKTTQNNFINGKEGQSVRSFNQFLVHADELKTVSSQLQRTNSPLLNIPLNKLSTYMGQPGVPEMMTAIEAARREWQTFIDSGYSPDEDQLKRAQILMSDTSSPATILGVLGVMGTQAVGRLDQLNESYRTAVGQDFPNLVTPSGATAAGHLGIDVSRYQSGGSYAGGPAKPTNVVPPGKFTAKDAQGNIVGYADDAKGTNYVPFK